MSSVNGSRHCLRVLAFIPLCDEAVERVNEKSKAKPQIWYLPLMSFTFPRFPLISPICFFSSPQVPLSTDLSWRLFLRIRVL